MGWLEKLKHFIKIELKGPLIDYTNITIKDSFKGKANANPVHIDEKKKKVYLNLAPLTAKQKEKLKPILQEYCDEGNKLLEEETADLLENLYKYNKENSNQQILEFFRPIIPREDSEALEASLYMRDIFRQHKNVKKLKKDIRDFLGARGTNIANLCTAGYFELFLMPLHNDTTKEKFLELYEIIVGKAVLAVFVHQQMKANEIAEQISKKIQISKKYGINFIHIHGIGETNVEKIKECINEKKEFFGFFEKKMFEKPNIIIIELLLK